jgi:hypothetical protein
MRINKVEKITVSKVIIWLGDMTRPDGLAVGISRVDSDEGMLVLAVFHMDTPIEDVRELANKYAARLGVPVEKELVTGGGTVLVGDWLRGERRKQPDGTL